MKFFKIPDEDGAADDGTRSCPLDAGPSSYYYSGGPYDYVSRLADQFHDVLHAAGQPLWNGCTTSQLAVVAELVDIKVDGHISERIYDRISQWEQNPNRKKTPYAILRYLPLTPRLQRLYASQATAE
ncbi:UNVERIFIED_CONTAM: hypothetical protein Slati_2982800 [Sesamum latifolium]|uniref:Uncharacterized protein n=1 Tax=Sesamum latifolium TaxID=2727402 RepID=A0AAW2VFD4_9LAMI